MWLANPLYRTMYDSRIAPLTDKRVEGTPKTGSGQRLSIKRYGDSGLMAEGMVVMVMVLVVVVGC